MPSYTATSDFKPSHPPTSAPTPPLSKAINHHQATGHWAQSKVTLHPATNTTGGWKQRERETEKEREKERGSVTWGLQWLIQVIDLLPSHLTTSRQPPPLFTYHH
ncbi:unnamed protein product [Pleuronectes platessa]|uniref:Uncharacterized protein n=1 Tax=Pleuronectes platessa TaxID=8262 RepID=A0A9N7Y4G8_PLEPL|nr:unnamed protein product [Pleuronectes platessa]